MNPGEEQISGSPGTPEKEAPFRRKFALSPEFWRDLVEWVKFLLGSVVFITLVYFGARVSLEWSQHVPWVLHLIVMLFWAVITLVWVRLITGERGRMLFIEAFMKAGTLWPPFVYSITLLVIAASVFASLSVTLQRYGQATFQPPLPKDLSPVVDFYMWHFLDSVPGLRIPETVHWVQPYQYSDHLSGWVLLAFKIAVIVPVIASFALWSGVRKDAVAERARAMAERSRKTLETPSPAAPYLAPFVGRKDD